MFFALRLFAVILISAVLTHGTALACVGTLSCSKTANVTEITTYPTEVTYTVTFSYSLPNDRCAVARLSDSLLSPGFFTFPADYLKDPNLFWVSNPPTATQFVTYKYTIESFDQCKAIGSPPAADGSVTVTNFVTGASYFDQEFACQREIICRPPSTGEGCTLTPGYWKTHSEFGPAPYDSTWAKLPNGASTPFFASGQTWFEVLWTDSAVGNAYYILARAYIAAVLNDLTGASEPDEVATAITFAQGFFTTFTPTSQLTKVQRATALAWATVLDNYNNGLIGPGHCQ